MYLTSLKIHKPTNSRALYLSLSLSHTHTHIYQEPKSVYIKDDETNERVIGRILATPNNGSGITVSISKTLIHVNTQTRTFM